MSQTRHRPLRRNRRPPSYFTTDQALLGTQEQEALQMASARHAPHKESKANVPTTKHLAEVLLKFINRANSYYKEYHQSEKSLEVINQSKIPTSKHNKTTPLEKLPADSHKKRTADQKHMEDDGARKSKQQLYNFKNQHLNPEQYLPGTQSVADSNRSESFGMNAERNPVGRNAQSPHPGQFKNQISGKHPNMIPPGMAHNPELTNKMLQQQQAMHSQSMRNQHLPYESQFRQGQRNLSELASDSKLFKRASFHVAIAYHIHLKKLKETGKELRGPDDFDPTFLARRLRQDKGKFQREQGVESIHPEANPVEESNQSIGPQFLPLQTQHRSIEENSIANQQPVKRKPSEQKLQQVHITKPNTESDKKDHSENQHQVLLPKETSVQSKGPSKDP